MSKKLNTNKKEKDETRRRKLISMTLKKSNKISADIHQAMRNDNSEDGYADWLKTRTTNLDKLHFIIGHGILTPQLRDEILAQVCKQLTRNPSKSSFARGWVLLSLCVGCFAPSDLLLNPLKAFLQAGPTGYAKFCLHRLKRTAENGPRSQPPSWVELQAIKYKKTIDVPVTLMDGSSRTVQVDSAMTAAELIASVSRHIGLVDSYGFSVFIAMYDKVSSLGSDGEHVLDAVSNCEQYAREQGLSERSASWRIFIRKEMFAPWHDSEADPVATRLISQEIIRGLRSGEYRCEKEADLATLAAQQYYMEHGLLDVRKIANSLSNLIPSHIFKTLNDEKLHRWVKLIEDAYEKNLKTRPKIDSVQQEIITFAKNKWALMFSRLFEIIELSGQTALPHKKPLVAAINSTGVHFLDLSEQVLLELSFVEIQSVALKQPGSTVLLHLITIDGIEMIFQGSNSNELHDLIKNILTEIKKRSKFVVATQNYNPPDDSPTNKPLMKGDLLQLTEPQTGESVAQSTWIEAYNERTQETGHFPSDCVAVVVSTVAPTPAIVSLLKEGPAAVMRPHGVGTIRRMKLYTLENYAREHFRVAGRASTISRGTSLSAIRQNEMEELWRHSREPIRRPLLRRLQQDELSAYACNAFIAILKYMGDQPSRRKRIGSEYTDKIFEAALKYEPLRDEIYCQIMKQLTGNRNKLSEERGWELMYLMTGSFPCSSELETELMKFLQSRRTSDIAQDCQLRFQRILKSGVRRYPPHQIEVDAIQHKHREIYHRVFFPDDSDLAFEVDSYTRASELVATIGQKLQLKSCDGFSLFIKVWNKVLSINEKEFFFDYVRFITDWLKKSLPGENTGQMQYQIFFMRKLWSASVDGRDRNADLIFHFPQELPKYLRGYHKVSKNDAAQLAALIFIAKFDNSAIETASAQTIQSLIPVDVFKQQKPKEWQKTVTAAMKEYKGLVSDDAKIEFLRFIQRWPTFGCAFFEVKQTTETNYPELILVAINRRGVIIFNPTTKDILAEHEYTHISNWSSGNTYFNMNIGAVTRGGGGGRLLMETPLGYKMDDLISSYTTMLYTMHNRRKSVKARAPAPPM